MTQIQWRNLSVSHHHHRKHPAASNFRGGRLLGSCIHIIVAGELKFHVCVWVVVFFCPERRKSHRKQLPLIMPRSRRRRPRLPFPFVSLVVSPSSSQAGGGNVGGVSQVLRDPEPESFLCPNKFSLLFMTRHNWIRVDGLVSGLWGGEWSREVQGGWFVTGEKGGIEWEKRSFQRGFRTSGVACGF